MAKAAKSFSLRIESQSEDSLRLSLSGRLGVESMEEAVREFSQIVDRHRPAALSLDLAKLEYLDSSGALGLCLMEKEAHKRGLELELFNLSPAAQNIKALIDLKAMSQKPLIGEERRLGFVEQVGQASQELGRDFVEVVTFLGEFLVAMSRAIAHPRRVRWFETAIYMEQVGVAGLPIVGLISFLLGTIIAFMSSLQLSSFGANIYVASLVGVGMVRELGPIMTAILVAGRSGSAFAAEIGTMKVNEEVDALEVMGFNPTNFLAIPKVLAAMIVVPLLTVYSCLAGIAGGLLVGVVGLNLTPYSYLEQTIKSLSAFGVISALIKSVFFAMLIAGIGCQRGFLVRGGAEAVGGATTSAVVSAMFLIIVADSGFAVLFYYVF